MTEFDDTRRRVDEAHAELEAARAALAASSVDLRRLRAGTGRGEGSAEEAEAAREVAAKRVAGARGALDEAAHDFAPLSDPRLTVGRLGPDRPFLLFPVRLETRWGEVPDGAASRRQLWVRIYPDTCLIDTFEPGLTDDELGSARQYWREVWRAGREVPDERAAWRNLVASHGSGRSGWIVDSYPPGDPGEHPTKAAPGEVLLVVATDAALGAGDRQAVSDLWPAVWRANGDAAAVDAATATLRAAVGSAHADELLDSTRPFNLDDKPISPATYVTAVVRVVFLELPAAPTKDQGWTEPPRARLLPDRFLLVADRGATRREELGKPIPPGLLLGPDPSAPRANQLRDENGTLQVPDELLWLVDFRRAIDVGMAFSLDVSDQELHDGFDRLMVLGVRAIADPDRTRKDLEELLAHHRLGRSGLDIVPVGTPTNNVEGVSAGFTRLDDPDASFAQRQNPTALVDEGDWRKKVDGVWLAEALGIDPAAVSDLPHASRTDQRDGRAMQAALWPATLGYFLGTMMAPVLSDDMIEETRHFYEEFVSGRGRVPSIRIGNQPYGILATTAFSRIDWIQAPALGVAHVPDRGRFLVGLRHILMQADADWADMANQVAAVVHGGDPHQELLDILGQHPGSAEFHYRYARSVEHLTSHLSFLGLGAAVASALAAWAFDAPALGLLANLGYTAPDRPEILKKYFHSGQRALNGPIVDDRPLSDVDGVRVWTDDGRNYLRWLIDSAEASLEALRREDGFIDDKPPKPLLYLLVRHALTLGYAEAGRELQRSDQASEAFLAALRREPAFIHLDPGSPASESRFVALYAAAPAIVGQPVQTLAERVANLLDTAPETAALRAQIDAIALLEDASTGRLERALVDHIDSASYRLDAWWLGLVNLQLDRMRRRDGTAGPVTTGLHLGAYGWLENVRPKVRALDPVELPPDLAAIFEDPALPPLRHDSSNGGYVHAPSINQAIAAAVLRNGYLSSASPTDPNALSVNLTSDRVRTGIEILEGIRNGQSLGALLGYRFERGLHDRHTIAEVDRFVFGLRSKFPLVANKIQSTADPNASIDAIEARNVLDGRRLVDHIRGGGQRDYPFGLAGLPPATAGQQAAIRLEVDELLNVADAIADLALAEGVFQSVQGNFDRVASTLETYSSGQYPPEPEIARTPAVGAILTHRVAVHLRPGLAAPAGATPRGVAEPALDAFVASILPSLARIGCRASWADPVSGVQNVEPVTLAQLGIGPLDVITLVRGSEGAAMTELDDRIVQRVRQVRALRPDTRVEVRYLERAAAGDYSVFETSALVDRVRSLVVRSRALLPGDSVLPGKATQGPEATVSGDPTRVAVLIASATALIQDLDLHINPFAPLPNEAALAAGIDAQIDDAAVLLARGASFGIPETGWGFALDWRQAEFAALVERLRARAAAFAARVAVHDERLLAFGLLPPGTPVDAQFAILREAEAAVSTSLLPTQATPAALQLLLPPKRAALDTRRAALAALADSATGTLAALVTATRTLLPLSDFDIEPFDVDEIDKRTAHFAEDVLRSVTGLRTELVRRRDAAQAGLTAQAAMVPGRARFQQLEAAAQALLGDDFHLIPEFPVASAHGDEWDAAVVASTTGELTNHLRTTLGVEFPVDVWLYGVARVREPVRHLEQILMLAGAFGRAEPDLVPMQLPHRPGQQWLALEFPDADAPDGERLLYTAWYTVAFDKAQPQCGLLLDEWSEVLPASTATTGLTFHFDRPNAEAPQAMLLVTPATTSGHGWAWEDLPAAVIDTFAMARKRAVEPSQLDASPYARFLPATVMATTVRGLSIGLTLAANNGALELMRAEKIGG